MENQKEEDSRIRIVLCASIVDEEKLWTGMMSIPAHRSLSKRFKKTLYYSKQPTTDRPSLPLTDVAIDVFADTLEFDELDRDYASSVARRACISPCALMLGLLYVKRLQKLNPDYLNNCTSSDLFLITMMISSKYLYDEGEQEEVILKEWATSAGINHSALRHIEAQFLSAIDWNLYVKTSEFVHLVQDVEFRIAWDQGLKRGWYTYTDLGILTDHNTHIHITLVHCVWQISKVIVLASALYTTCVLSGALLASIITINNNNNNSGTAQLYTTTTTTTTTPAELSATPGFTLHREILTPYRSAVTNFVQGFFLGLHENPEPDSDVEFCLGGACDSGFSNYANSSARASCFNITENHDDVLESVDRGILSELIYRFGALLHSYEESRTGFRLFLNGLIISTTSEHTKVAPRASKCCCTISGIQSYPADNHGLSLVNTKPQLNQLAYNFAHSLTTDSHLLRVF